MERLATITRRVLRRMLAQRRAETNVEGRLADQGARALGIGRWHLGQALADVGIDSESGAHQSAPRENGCRRAAISTMINPTCADPAADGSPLGVLGQPACPLRSGDGARMEAGASWGSDAGPQVDGRSPAVTGLGEPDLNWKRAAGMTGSEGQPTRSEPRGKSASLCEDDDAERAMAARD